MDSNSQENLSQLSPSTDCMGNNSEDWVCPTKDPKDDQSTKFGFLHTGEHEMQFSEGSSDTYVPLKDRKCEKNPGHLGFISIDSFTIEDLPESYQNSDFYELIKATADMTVKIDVTMTSPDRPEFWPNTKDPYHLSKSRGKACSRTGSGMIAMVLHGNDANCPCDKCETSDQPSKRCWDIIVTTAAHMVVDDIEARHTTLTLFFDREDSDVAILKDKMRVQKLDIKQDWCSMTCVTCDENLGNKLDKMRERFLDAWAQVMYAYRGSRDYYKIHFIVSHPHGCTKHVSIGQWKEKKRVGEEDYDHQFSYLTSTCPGSSGAPVHFFGYNSLFTHLVHSGSVKNECNYSATGYVIPWL